MKKRMRALDTRVDVFLSVFRPRLEELGALRLGGKGRTGQDMRTCEVAAS